MNQHDPYNTPEDEQHEEQFPQQEQFGADTSNQLNPPYTKWGVGIGIVILIGVAGAIIFFLNRGELIDTQPFGNNTFVESDTAVFVSPEGDGANPGTKAEPFKTLERARDAVRTMNDSMTENIHVYLREGTYTLPRTLVLDERDSGMNGFNIVYEAYNGENVVISGGRTITGWQEAGNGLIKADVGDLDTRQLFVNGKRVVRARSTDALIADIYKIPANNTQGYTTTNLEMQNWQNQNDIEFVYRSKLFWPEHRCAVERIEGTTITMQQPCFSRANILGEKKLINGMNVPTFIENAFELLDEPGEWYLNKQTGTLYYYPLDGESAENVEVIAPELEILVHGKGDNSFPVHNIQFKNLQFSYATWLGINDHGFPNQQASVYWTGDNFLDSAMMPANVIFERAEDIVLEWNTFTHLGAAGLGLIEGPKRITVKNNIFTDISGSAIQLGDHLRRNPETQNLIVEDNDISYNRIYDVAAEFASGVGIHVAFAANTTIEHNELYNLPYCGISIGWEFSSIPTAAKDNKIRYNYIHDFLKVNGDCGGLYSLGYQPGSEYAYNVIINQANRRGGGLYMDQGSKGIDVHHNILFNNQPNVNVNSPELFDLHHNWWQNRPSVDDPELNRYLDDIDLLNCFEGKAGAGHCKEEQTQLYDNNVITSLDEVPRQILEQVGIDGVSCEDGTCDPETEIVLCYFDCAEIGNGVCDSGEFFDLAPDDCALPDSFTPVPNDAFGDEDAHGNNAPSCIARCLEVGDPRSACEAYCARE